MERHSRLMKTHRLILVALLASTFAGCSRHPTTATTTPQTVSFGAFTNGYVGPLASVFARGHPAAIQQWLTAGTNSALFTITNQQTCDIIIFPIGRIWN